MLQKLGLNDLQSSIYNHLIEFGPLEIKNIASELDVPSSKAYTSINQLEMMRLVIKTRTRPSTISAVSPKQAIAILLSQKREELEIIEQDAFMVEKELNTLAGINKIESNFISFNYGPKLREEKFRLIVNTKSSLDTLLSLDESKFAGGTKQLDQLFDSFDSILAKSVNIRLIIQLTLESKISFGKYLSERYSEKSKLLNRLKIRETTDLYGLFYIFDRREVFLKITDPQTGNLDFASIYVWEKTFVQLYLNKFEELWDKSIELPVTESNPIPTRKN